MLSKLKNSSVLVVGGAGFVGSNLANKLLEAQCQKIIIIDNLLSSEREKIPLDHKIIFWEGSITDDNILAQIKDEYDYIFHIATYHGNQSSIHDPLADHENNTLTTLKLFNWIREFKNLKKVVYSGAGCAVAEKNILEASATEESDLVSLHMDSPYSISKILGEFYAIYYHKQHNLPTVRARFQNVYGPGEILGAGKWRGTPATIWRNVIPTFIYKALDKQTLPLENNGIGTRDFIFVDDICNGLMLCAVSGKPGDVYNLATGVEISIRNLAEAINNLTDNPTPVKMLPKRDWDNSIKRFGSTEKSKRELGFSAKVNFDDGITKTIEWTKENLNFIKKSMVKHNKYYQLN